MLSRFRAFSSKYSCSPVVSVCFFFFFQAEDGIRDLTVTGVQTCALPISLVSRAYVTKVLNGNPNLTIKTLLKLSDALGRELAIHFVPKPDRKLFSSAQDRKSVV